jgi:hypothetical protein
MVAIETAKRASIHLKKRFIRPPAGLYKLTCFPKQIQRLNIHYLKDCSLAILTLISCESDYIIVISSPLSLIENGITDALLSSSYLNTP